MKKLSGLIALLVLTPCLSAAPPQINDDRLEIEVLLEHPDIVTPIGITCDERGRLFVTECHTHFRPNDYDGPPQDRIRLMEDADGDGTFEKVSTFRDGLRLAMGIEAASPTRIYVITRSDVRLLEDVDDDGAADKETVLVRLDTPGNYPHNGLSGITLGPLGNLYFSLGENLGEPYTVIGSDGTKLSGGGEGGNIYRCRPDGSRLEHLATGFWNTFGLGFDRQGNLFAVDNDPDSRPPCRLLHVVRGGDYGFRFRNGRKGTHPFTAWDGELPGTLPMTAGTGEAPCDVMVCDGATLSGRYRGQLLVTSWGDHRVDLVQLKPRPDAPQTSWLGESQPLVEGDRDFRPVDVCQGPRGELYFTDWMLKNYPLHRHGRVWRLQVQGGGPKPALLPSEAASLSAEKQDELAQLLGSPQDALRRAAARRLAELAESPSAAALIKQMETAPDTSARLELLWGYLRAGMKSPDDLALLQRESAKDRPELLREAIRHWPQPELDAWSPASLEDLPSAVLLLRRSQQDRTELALRVLRGHPRDPFVLSAVVAALRQATPAKQLQALTGDKHPRMRLAALLAVRARPEASPQIAKRFLYDDDPAVRRASVQWVAEAGYQQLTGDLEKSLQENATPAIFRAYLAARERLEGSQRTKGQKFTGHGYALEVFRDDRMSGLVRRLALSTLPPNHEKLSTDDFLGALQEAPIGVKREVVWTYQEAPRPQVTPRLLELIGDAGQPLDLRADIVHALAAVKDQNQNARALLEKLAGQEGHPLQPHAARVLRPKGTKAGDLAGPSRPKSLEQWLKAAQAGGNPENGRRIFFQRNGVGCYQCHTVRGRGGIAGPELTRLPTQLGERRLVESILDPSQEIAPQFTSWTAITTAGKQLTGILLRKNLDGDITLADQEGRIHQLKGKQIEELVANRKSLMPDKLIELLSTEEFRDLIAYLQTLR